MRGFTKAIAAACTVALAALSAGCGQAVQVEVPGQASGPMVTIGVADDEPGMSWYHDGTYGGFGIEVATTVANTLGYSSKQVVFRSVGPDEREAMLDDGSVDLVFGAYGDPVEGAGHGVVYAGTYLVAQGALLVRHGDAGRYDDPQDLAGHRVCVTEGSVEAGTLPQLVPGVDLDRRSSYQQCVSALLVGSADAVAAAAPVVMGLRDQAGAQYVSVAEAGLPDVSFGIGVRAGQSTLVKRLDAAIATMVRDGSWQRAADGLRQQVGFAYDPALNPPVAADR